MANVVPLVESGCWVWVGGSKGGDRAEGYYGGWKSDYAHRVAYRHWVGPIPPGLELDHLCRVRRCCNPEHLEAVTRAVNERRALAIRTHCPAGHPFTPENVRYTPRGHRQCRVCARNWAKAYHHRKHPNAPYKSIPYE